MKYALPIAIAVLVGFAAVTALKGRVAPTPAVFSADSSLEAAIEQAGKENKPVLALVTADWCPPCQSLKRETLSDPEVAAWIGANTVPVYIDSDTSPEDAASLGVRALPTTVLLRDGEVVASNSGFIQAGDYLAFLKNAVQ